MSETPLFPLNTVLFPNTPVHLHIFEERYKRMIGMCIQEKRPFGIVLIRKGAEALGPLAEPYEVGCLGNIVDMQHLEAGRINLAVMGTERFRIRSLDTHSQPYLVGQIEPFPWTLRDQARAEGQGRRLRSHLLRFLELLSTAGGAKQSMDVRRLPNDPIALACIAASILQIDPSQKQALLELEDGGDFVERVLETYRREQALMQALLVHGDRDRDQPFSQN